MPENGQRSFGEIFQQAVGHIQEIVRAEIRLARTEIREEIVKAKAAAVMLGGGAVAGLFAAALVVVACACALAIVVPWWAASLIMAVLCGIVAGAMLASGRKMLKGIRAPGKTARTVSENLEWARNQTR